MGTKADSRMAQSVCYLCVHGLRGLVRRDVHHDEHPSLGAEDRKQHFLVATRRQVSGETRQSKKGRGGRTGEAGREMRSESAQPRPGCQALSRKGLITIPGGGWEGKSLVCLGVYWQRDLCQ